MKRVIHKWLGALAIVLLTGFVWAPTDLAAQRSIEDIVVTESPRAGLRFHSPAEFESLTSRLEEEGDPLLDELRAELGLKQFPTVEVWVLRKVGDYYRLQGLENRAPEWAAGLSLRNKATIILVNGVGSGGEMIDIDATFKHELAHVAMDVASAGRGVPRWFNEGYALMHAAEWTAERSTKLSQAAAGGALTPFSNLTDYFPAHHNSASLAYAQSYHFVRHLGEQFGDDVYGGILERVRSGKSFDDAFKAETGQSLKLAEARWKQELESSASGWAILSDEMVLFFGASLLFLVAWGVRRYRTRKRLAQMALEDADRAWDYDESQYPLPGER